MDFIGPAMMGGGPVFWGQADVSVDGQPISGVSISMQPGMTIAGKVQFKGTRLVQDGDLSRIRLTLAPAPSAAGAAVRLNMGGLPTAVFEPNGQFKFNGVTPGRYRVTGIAPVPMGSPPGLSWTMLSAVANGRDVLDFPLEVGPAGETGEIVVTFADAVQEVNGSLQDGTGRPAPDYTIIVFAADNRFWTTPTRRVRSTRPGTDGKFTVANLPPGDYRVAAVVDVSPTESPIRCSWSSWWPPRSKSRWPRARRRRRISGFPGAYHRVRAGTACRPARETPGLSPGIDSDALRVLHRLQQHKYVAYLVGGSVRDPMLGRRQKDFDIGTDAHPGQIKKLFRNC